MKKKTETAAGVFLGVYWVQQQPTAAAGNLEFQMHLPRTRILSYMAWHRGHWGGPRTAKASAVVSCWQRFFLFRVKKEQPVIDLWLSDWLNTYLSDSGEPILSYSLLSWYKKKIVTKIRVKRPLNTTQMNGWLYCHVSASYLWITSIRNLQICIRMIDGVW